MHSQNRYTRIITDVFNTLPFSSFRTRLGATSSHYRVSQETDLAREFSLDRQGQVIDHTAKCRSLAARLVLGPTVMHFITGTAILIVAVVMPFYLHALIKFHGIVRSKRSDWAERKGSLSFFYEGFPKVFDPNIGVAVLGTAFSRRIYELRTPKQSCMPSGSAYCCHSDWRSV